MARTTRNTILWGIAYLPIFLVTLLVVTDVETIGSHFYGDAPFALGAFLADLWPGPLLKALVIVASFAIFASERFHKYLGRLQLHGTTFVLLFFLVLLLTCIFIIDHNQLYYPQVFELERELVAMKLALTVLPLPIAALLLNESFARPAPTVLVIGLWVTWFAAVKIWSVNVFTGKLDFLSPITMWFGD